MALTELFTPTHIYFGRDAEKECGRVLSSMGYKKVLIHYGKGSVVHSGLLERVKADLRANGLDSVEFGGVAPNPRASLVREAIKVVKKEGCDFILALGGGSVLDSAKAICYGVANAGDFWDFYIGRRKPEAFFPLGAILTLAATGSEMSSSSVITNEEGSLKRGLNTDMSRPLVAFLNPCLTYSVSPYQTGSGTVDIMMHTLERFFHTGFSLPLTDEMAITLLRVTMESGKRALECPEDYEARANLMWAGSLSHNGLMNLGNDVRGDWACHQIEHELSGLYDVAHGAGLSAIWPSWARYVSRFDSSRFVRLGEALFSLSPALSKEEATERTIVAMENYFKSLNMPTTLTELGLELSDKELKELADNAVFHGRRTLGNIKTLKSDDIYQILLLAR